MLATLRARLRAIADEYLQGVTGCHRLDHTLRVVAQARTLAAQHPEADADVVEAAAWLHDIGRRAEQTEGLDHAQVSADLARELLPELSFSPAQVLLAVAAIADHRFSAGRVPASIEGQILQDADRLDALGAIGIARTFAEGRDREMYDPDDPLAQRRPLDDDQYALDHFFIKLLKLSATLHTPEARALGEERTRVIQHFVRAFVEQVGVAAANGYNIADGDAE